MFARRREENVLVLECGVEVRVWGVHIMGVENGIFSHGCELDIVGLQSSELSIVLPRTG